MTQQFSKKGKAAKKGIDKTPRKKPRTMSSADDKFGIMLIEAINEGKEYEAEEILQTNAGSINVNSMCLNTTPLMAAIEKGPYIDLIETILRFGADPNIQDPSNGKTPLMLASAKGSVELVRMLLYSGVNLRATDNEGKTALDYAADVEISAILSMYS